MPKLTQNISAQDVKNLKEFTIIENKLNNRPRKSLGWRTPNEVFFGLEMAA